MPCQEGLRIYGRDSGQDAYKIKLTFNFDDGILISNEPGGGMYKGKYVVLIVLMAAIFVFPCALFAAEKGEKSDKDAILQELGSFIDRNSNMLRTVIFSMGDEYSRENKTDEAVALYEKAVKILPKDEDFLNRLGSLYNQKRDYAKAAEVYKKMTEMNPANTWYFNMLSDAYRNAGEKEKAIAVWEELAKSSKDANVFMQAANFYSSENDIEKAITAVKKASEFDPKNVSYLQSLESFYMRLEKFNEAEAVCKKVIEISEDQWSKDWAGMELINIYQRQNKLPELAARFEKELAQAPKELGNYKKLAELYQRNNERDKAIGVYEKASGDGIADRDIHDRLLNLYEQSEDIDKAKKLVEKMVEMVPGDTYLYERLANLLGRAGKIDEAKKAWGRFLEKVQGDAGAFSRYGDRLNEWGETDSAIEQYRKAQVLDVNNLWYTMRIADILIAKEKFDVAKKELNNIIARTTDTWMKQEAERKLNDINARMGASKEVPPFPETAKPEKGEIKEKPVPVIEPEPEKDKDEKAPAEKPEKKRKGWFGR